MPKNVTISVSDDLSKKMDEMKDVNWSEVCRRAITGYIEVKQPNKGTIIKDLERYIRSKTDEMTYEDRIAFCDVEIERFTKKWGKPDSIQYDDRPGMKKAFVILRKKQDIKIEDRNLVTIKIRTPTFHDLIEPTDIVEFKPDKWKDFAEGKLAMVVDYFKSQGYSVGEYRASWIMIYAEYFSDGNIDLFEKDPHHQEEVSILLALDKEDVVFIAYRKAKFSSVLKNGRLLEEIE
jgi:hypothetical protein